MGMCIKWGVDLIAFKTSRPEIFGSERDREKSNPAWRRSRIFPFLWTYASASSPSETERNPLVSPAALKASSVRRVSAGLLSHNENFDLFTRCRQIATEGRAGHGSPPSFLSNKKGVGLFGRLPILPGINQSSNRAPSYHGEHTGTLNDPRASGTVRSGRNRDRRNSTRGTNNRNAPYVSALLSTDETSPWNIGRRDRLPRRNTQLDSRFIDKPQWL